MRPVTTTAPERRPDVTDKVLTKHLIHYLADAHSIEEQALQQLRTAPEMAGEPGLARLFSEHLIETEGHEREVRKRLESYDKDPSRLKDAIMRAGGAAFILFARVQPDTPGKLTTHAYSYEHLEYACYEILLRTAQRAGDEETASTARNIRDNESEMAARLENEFDRATDASLAAVADDDLQKLLGNYLRDAHAIEAQAHQMLKLAAKRGGTPALDRLYAQHLEETNEHLHLLEQRLKSRDESTSAVKDIGMRMAALNWGAFFQAQPDTAVKLAGFSYAFEHLEIGGYELLKRVAVRAADDATVDTTETILDQERAMALRLREAFDEALDSDLA